jgi:nucleoside-diphosphate-sugar epimerase
MRRFVRMVFDAAGRSTRLRAVPRWVIALAALFDPTLRSVREQLYQSERPWVLDSSKFERAFGWQATPLPDAVATTVAWFQDRATFDPPLG